MAGVIANATASLTRDFQGQGLMLVMRTTAIRRLSPFPGTLKPARVETRQGTRVTLVTKGLYVGGLGVSIFFGRISAS